MFLCCVASDSDQNGSFMNKIIFKVPPKTMYCIVVLFSS